MAGRGGEALPKGQERSGGPPGGREGLGGPSEVLDEVGRLSRRI